MKLQLLTTFCIFFKYSTSSEWAFDDKFKFGVSTSTYQIEGGYNEDGKGLNLWDVLTHTTPGLIADGSTGDIACDSYHKWQEDIQMIKNMGVKYYRLSLSWTRLFPKGFNYVVNPAGLANYHNLIDGLKENGIEPVVTIYHWDTPYNITQLASFANADFIEYFSNFADFVFKEFGKKVKYWITFNEPYEVCVAFNQINIILEPAYPGGIVEYKCVRTLLLSHAAAYKIYQQKYKLSQKGKVGITLSFQWSQHATNNKSDIEAAETRRQFEFGIFAGPIFQGDYPKIVQERVARRSKLEGFQKSRLEPLTLRDKAALYGKTDFLGINHYTACLVSATEEAPIGDPSFVSDEGTTCFQPSDWENSGIPGNKVVPWALTLLLKWVKDTYRNPEVIITECGYADETGALEDAPRISYIKRYLEATLEAIVKYKTRVSGFFVWSLMDDFEWTSGYTVKFGLYNVDFNSPNRTRTAKNSVAYYKSVVETRTP